MERSHWQAQGAFQSHTRHGGGVGGSNGLQELFTWHFRMMMGVQNENEKNLQKTLFALDKEQEAIK